MPLKDLKHPVRQHHELHRTRKQQNTWHALGVALADGIIPDGWRNRARPVTRLAGFEPLLPQRRHRWYVFAGPS